VDQQIEDAQRVICECLGLDHSSLWQASTEDPSELVLTHLYRDPNLPPPPQRMAGTEFLPWAQAKLVAGEIISVPNTSEAPPEAGRDMETWRHFGVRSTLGLPLAIGGGGVFGVLSFDATREMRAFPEPLVKRLQLIAQLFANALDRQRAEQKLRDSETRLNLAASSANAGLWTLEPETGHVWATPKTYELFALPQSEEINLDSFLAVVHPEDRSLVSRIITEAMQSGEEPAVEYRVVRPNGDVHWIASRGRRQQGNDWEPDRLMGVSIDVTKSKRTELELLKLRERLQAESDYLKEEIRIHGHFEEIVGQSEELKNVFLQIEQVSPTDSTVLIIGETGN